MRFVIYFGFYIVGYIKNCIFPFNNFFPPCAIQLFYTIYHIPPFHNLRGIDMRLKNAQKPSGIIKKKVGSHPITRKRDISNFTARASGSEPNLDFIKFVYNARFEISRVGEFQISLIVQTLG